MDYVRVEGVHKSFVRKYGAPSLKAHVDRRRRDKVDVALAGVSFTVASGESLAVLGRRQSGRSTLISMLNGLYRPDAGSVEVRGRPAGPIALGVAFASDLSAEDNMTLNAELQGMSSDDLQARRDEIIAFSRLRPVELASPLKEIDAKTRQRLAYAIMIHVEPDVLLADGRVVVGDRDFREASLDRLESLRDDGHALVLATNTRSLVRRLCTRAIVLDKGLIVFDGDLKPAFRALRELREQ